MPMTESGEDTRGQVLYRVLARTLYLALTLVLLVFFVHAVRWVAELLLLTLVLFLLLNPTVTWLEGKGLARGWGSGLCLLVILIVLAGLVLIVAPPVVDQCESLGQNLPAYQASASAWLKDFLGQYPYLGEWLDPANLDVQGATRQMGTVVARLGRYTLGALGITVSLVVLFALLGYMLANPRPLVRSYLLAFPHVRRKAAAAALARSEDMIAGWMRSNLIIGAAEALLVGAFLGLMHVPGALVWAVLAFFGELVPTLGPILMAIPPVLVALAVNPVTAMWVLVFFVVTQRLLSDVLGPRIRASYMALHPASLIVGVLAMATAFGAIGAFLAGPVVAILKACYEEFGPPRQPADDSLDAEVEAVMHRELVVRPTPASEASPLAADEPPK
jgi:putative permease